MKISKHHLGVMAAVLFVACIGYLAISLFDWFISRVPPSAAPDPDREKAVLERTKLPGGYELWSVAHAGHHYIVLNGSPSRAMIHSPDCPCRK